MSKEVKDKQSVFQAMLLLSDISGYKLHEHYFADFMNGKKQIEL